jgi:RNA-binding protein
MDTKAIKELRARAKHLRPVLQVGKNGITQGTLNLVEHELGHKQLIKIKLLKGALPADAKKADRERLAAEIATKSKAMLIEHVGNVVVLYRSGSGKR